LSLVFFAPVHFFKRFDSATSAMLEGDPDECLVTEIDDMSSDNSAIEIVMGEDGKDDMSSDDGVAVTVMDEEEEQDDSCIDTIEFGDEDDEDPRLPPPRTARGPPKRGRDDITADYDYMAGGGAGKEEDAPDHLEDILDALNERIDLKAKDIPDEVPDCPQEADSKYSALLKAMEASTETLTVHQIMGNGLSEERAKAYLREIAGEHTYASAAADFCDHLVANGYGLPFTEPYPKDVEEAHMRPPDITIPWEQPCVEGTACQCYTNAIDQNCVPFVGLTFAPASTREQFVEFERRKALGHNVDAEVAQFNRENQPLTCSMCHIYHMNIHASQKDEERLSEVKTKDNKEMVQWFYQIFEVDGEYDKSCMLPNNGYFVGLLKPIVRYNKRAYIYVEDAYFSKGQNKWLPGYKIAADLGFRSGAATC